MLQQRREFCAIRKVFFPKTCGVIKVQQELELRHGRMDMHIEPDRNIATVATVTCQGFQSSDTYGGDLLESTFSLIQICMRQ
jgi:hypothetical protein